MTEFMDAYRERIYKLLPRVREPNQEERRFLEGVGYIFLHTFEKSLYRVVLENSGYFVDGARDYVLGQPNLRKYVPPEMTIAIHPTRGIRGGLPIQIDCLDQRSQTLQASLASARELILPTSSLAQADIKYSELKKGRAKLFSNHHVRTLDQIDESSGSSIGRFGPMESLGILAWPVMGYFNHVVVVSAIIFIR